MSCFAVGYGHIIQAPVIMKPQNLSIISTRFHLYALEADCTDTSELTSYAA